MTEGVCFGTLHTVDLTDEQVQFVAQLIVRHMVATTTQLRSRAVDLEESRLLNAEIFLGAVVLGRLPHRPSLGSSDQHIEALQV